MLLKEWHMKKFVVIVYSGDYEIDRQMFLDEEMAEDFASESQDNGFVVRVEEIEND